MMSPDLGRVTRGLPPPPAPVAPPRALLLCPLGEVPLLPRRLRRPRGQEARCPLPNPFRLWKKSGAPHALASSVPRRGTEGGNLSCRAEPQPTVPLPGERERRRRRRSRLWPHRGTTSRQPTRQNAEASGIARGGGGCPHSTGPRAGARRQSAAGGQVGAAGGCHRAKRRANWGRESCSPTRTRESARLHPV